MNFLFSKNYLTYLFQWANSNEQKIFRRKNFLQLAYNGLAPDAVAAWWTRFLHLGENENRKKNWQWTE